MKNEMMLLLEEIDFLGQLSTYISINLKPKDARKVREVIKKRLVRLGRISKIIFR